MDIGNVPGGKKGPPSRRTTFFDFTPQQGVRARISGWEQSSCEIRFFANGEDVSASSWQWKLRAQHAVRAEQAELQLDIELESAGMRVTKHYVIYPGTSVIREWLTLENSSDIPIRISQVDFLHSRVLGSIEHDLQFNYLTGEETSTVANS